MTDLTKITTPFGLLDPETQAALKAWPHGWEFYGGQSGWSTIETIYWNWNHAYRAKPAPLTKPSINWSHVAARFVALARDEDGGAFLSCAIPTLGMLDGEWFVLGNALVSAGTFASFRPGTCDWRDSLVLRPEGV